MNGVHKDYKDLFSVDNLFSAWFRFRRGKAGKTKVMEFARHLADNIVELYDILNNHKYKHSGYSHFVVNDNKKRDIYVAQISDKIIHQIISDYLISIYEPIFIENSYSSRIGKGTHKALQAFRYFSINAGGKNRRIFVLKCDIRKYFDNIDHNILLQLIERKIKDKNVLSIISEIIRSFESGNAKGKGIPLGNVTSQIFANIYLNELDCFAKKILRARFYVRYNDDFLVIDDNFKRLSKYLAYVRKFLSENLLLDVPKHKAEIRKLDWGVDFLGYTILPNSILLSGKTKSKIFKRCDQSNFESYFGILRHCDSFRLRQKLEAVLDDFENYLC
jgi:RNA-directed DNA polymerase